MEKFYKALKALHVKGKIKFAEIAHNRLLVLLNGQYFGMWDTARELFVD